MSSAANFCSMCHGFSNYRDGRSQGYVGLCRVEGCIASRSGVAWERKWITTWKLPLFPKGVGVCVLCFFLWSNALFRVF